MRRQSNNGNSLCSRQRFELPRCCPTVQHRQTHIHQDQIGLFRLGHLHALGTVNGNHHLIAAPLQAPRQHIPVHFVIFHQQNLCHLFLPLCVGNSCPNTRHHSVAHLLQECLAYMRAKEDHFHAAEALAIVGSEVSCRNHHSATAGDRSQRSVPRSRLICPGASVRRHLTRFLPALGGA